MTMAAPVVRVAEHAGACYGVNRALGLVEDALDGAKGPVRTLGPLIHNPSVVAALAARGAEVAEDCDLPAGTTLVLRTHGVAPQVIADALARGLEVIDATCPFVTKTHVAARMLAEEGYQVVVVGEAGHPEVEATCAHAPGALVVGSADDAETAELGRRVGLVVQTTQSAALLAEVVARIAPRVEELRVLNTICDATSERQRAAASLAEESDCMVVIGGRNSANTTRLAEICQSRCPDTRHVEQASEIEPSWLIGKRAIGVTAGASTPAAQIEEAVRTIRAATGAADPVGRQAGDA
jgi:4-hydroxy-3-methylbut-2-enyl diphosphate reductase